MSIGPEKILCISSTGMGNCILYLPVIKTLKKSFPNANIDLLVSNRQALQLLENVKEINEVIYYSKTDTGVFKKTALFSFLKRKQYDLGIISFLDNSPKVAGLLFALAIKERIGFDFGWWKYLYTKRAKIEEKKHEVEYNLALIKEIGISGFENSIDIPISEKDKSYAAGFLQNAFPDKKSLIIGMHPGSGTDIGKSAKRWPGEKFAELINKITLELDANIVICGGEEERGISEELLLSSPKGTVSCAGKLTIKQSAALISMCDLFISNDSGLMHIAASMKVPIVAIFGPTIYWKNYPWNVKHEIVRKDLECSPCYKYERINCKDERCLGEIDAEDVMYRIRKLVLGSRVNE